MERVAIDEHSKDQDQFNLAAKQNKDRDWLSERDPSTSCEGTQFRIVMGHYHRRNPPKNWFWSNL